MKIETTGQTHREVFCDMSTYRDGGDILVIRFQNKTVCFCERCERVTEVSEVRS